MVDALPAAVYVTDAAGHIVYYNAAAVALWGCQPELGTSQFCGSWKLESTDGKPLAHEDSPMAIALREGRAVRGVETVAVRPDGSRVPFLPCPTPLFDEQGMVTGAVNLLLDVSDRRDSENLLAAIVDSSSDAIIGKDLNGIIKSWNGSAQRLFGYSASEVIGKPVSILIPPDRPNEEPSILARLRLGERVEHYETVRRRKDGTLIDISLTISPVRDRNGRIVGASKIARDISEKKRAENELRRAYEAAQSELEQRRRAEERGELLLKELNHRVKNSLATIHAIARQTFKKGPREERESFEARLQALASAHDLLLRRQWNRATIGEVVARALVPFELQRERFTVTEGPEVWLEATRSTLMIMVLHELATNAVKYGALSTDTGRIDIAWRTSAGDSQIVEFVWRETGVADVRPPKQKGFGSRLIERAITKDLGTARLEYGTGGIVCTLDLRIEPVADYS